MQTSQMDFAVSDADREIEKVDGLLDRLQSFLWELEGAKLDLESVRDILVITKIGCMRMSDGGPDSQESGLRL